MATLNFNAAAIEPQETKSFDALPVGRYSAMIVDSEMKTTKAGNGQYLQLTFDILGPTHVGRKVWARLNLSNPNKTAEEIAQRELSAICHCLGLEHVEESEELHDIPLLIDVGQEKNTQTGDMTNRIKGYAAEGDAVGAAKVQAAAQQVATKKAAPWAKK
jgi:hypothetical protein